MTSLSNFCFSHSLLLQSPDKPPMLTSRNLSKDESLLHLLLDGLRSPGKRQLDPLFLPPFPSELGSYSSYALSLSFVRRLPLPPFPLPASPSLKDKEISAKQPRSSLPFPSPSFFAVVRISPNKTNVNDRDTCQSRVCQNIFIPGRGEGCVRTPPKHRNYCKFLS